ncbi:MAG: hypothetical protein V1737_01800, partial [Chloroflexota bacterium]
AKTVPGGTDAVRCAAHPDVETSARCSKCLKPICPKCQVDTPVGYRCRECASVRKLPAFNLVALDYVKATFAGLGASAASGIVWLVVRTMTPYMSFFNFFLAAAVGYGIGEAISLSVNRKRGRLLGILAGLCMVIAFVIGNGLALSGRWILVFNLYNLVAIAAGIYLAVSRL